MNARTLTTTLGLALAFAAAPAAAHANTYCVHGPCGLADEDYGSLAPALSEASKHPGLDRIEIGAGTLSDTNVSSGGSDNPVEIVGSGSGPGGTRLVGATGASGAVLRLRSLGSKVSGLKIEIGSGTTGGGLALEKGDASDIVVTDAPGPQPTTKGAGVTMGSGTNLTHARVVMADPLDENLIAVNVTAAYEQTSSVEDSELSGSNGLVVSGRGVVQARRLNVFDSHVGIAARDAARLIVASSLVRVNRGPGSTALQSGSSEIDTPALIQGRGLTLVGEGSDTFGVATSGQSTGTTSRVELSDSIIHGATYSVWRYGADQGNSSVELAFTDYDPSRVSQGGPGSVTGGANVNVDPGFVDPAAGDYRLRGDSPLIEAGNDYPFDPFQGVTDLAGAPRLVDNDGNGRACADMGAYEYQGSVGLRTSCERGSGPNGPDGPVQTGGPVTQQRAARDTVAPAVSGFALSRAAVRRGSKSKVTARFSLSEAATVRLTLERRTGRGRKALTVTVGSLERRAAKGKSTVTLTGKLRPAGLKPGSYRLAITARDAADNRSAVRRVTFRVTPKR